MSHLVIDIQVAPVMGVDDLRLVGAHQLLDGLDHVEERHGVHSVVWKPQHLGGRDTEGVRGSLRREDQPVELISSTVGVSDVIPRGSALGQYQRSDQVSLVDVTR